MALFTATKKLSSVGSCSLDNEPGYLTDQRYTDHRTIDGVARIYSQDSSSTESKKEMTAELQKVVISRKKWPVGLLVHIVPVLGAGAIIAINLRGYYIGTQFVGVYDSTSQSIALLSLQVTAKLLEMTAVASLGYIILDILHHFLLFDEAGLPLALTGIRFSFSNLFSLASPTFWSGIQAFRSCKARILVVFLLISCGLIATFIGPAAALLLIPAIRRDWLAGSLFWKIPHGHWLTWDLQVNSSGISPYRRSLCVNPSEDIVSYPGGDFESCIWGAAAILGSVVTQMDIPSIGNVTVQDYDLRRDISWSIYDNTQTWPTLWAWSSMSVTNTIAGNLFGSWYLALNSTNPNPSMDERNFGLEVENITSYNAKWNSLSQYSRYAFRDRFGTQTKLQGMLGPSARTACIWSIRDFRDKRPYSFPIIPLNHITPQDTNGTYMIPTNVLAQNTSITRTFWISKPKLAPEILGLDNEPEYSRPLPSAFLISQFPVVNGTHEMALRSTTFGPVVTCSIDARWTDITQFTTLFDGEANIDTDDDTMTPETYSTIDETMFDAQGRPSPGKILPRISLDHSWLEILTPTFNQTTSGTNITQRYPGHTSLSKMIDSLLSSQLNGGAIPPTMQGIDDWINDIVWRLQHLLSLLVVDGLARYNTDKVFASNFLELVPLFDPESKTFDPAILLAAGGKPPQLQENLPKLETSQFIWTVTVSGFAYVIDSMAYILAVAVLSTYILFAICHICFTIYKRCYSKIWWSIPDIITLVHLSPPSALSKGISSDTPSNTSNDLMMKLRVSDDLEKGSKAIHLLIDSHQQGQDPDKLERYRKLEKGEKYY